MHPVSWTSASPTASRPSLHVCGSRDIHPLAGWGREGHSRACTRPWGSRHLWGETQPGGPHRLGACPGGLPWAAEQVWKGPRFQGRAGGPAARVGFSSWPVGRRWPGALGRLTLCSGGPAFRPRLVRGAAASTGAFPTRWAAGSKGAGSCRPAGGAWKQPGRAPSGPGVCRVGGATTPRVPARDLPPTGQRLGLARRSGRQKPRLPGAERCFAAHGPWRCPGPAARPPEGPSASQSHALVTPCPAFRLALFRGEGGPGRRPPCSVLCCPSRPCPAEMCASQR